MLTIKAEVRKDGLRVDQTYNVKVRFTLNRQTKRLSTSLFVSKNDLTKTLMFKEGTDIKRQVDSLILSYQRKCAELQVDINSYTLDNIIEYLERGEKMNEEIDFVQFSQTWIENSTSKGKKNYRSALNAFVDFLGKPGIDARKITQGMLAGFLQYIEAKREEKVRKQVKAGKRITSNRASSLYLGSIRHLFKEAQRKYNDYDRNIICIPNDPFMGFKVPKQEATRKRALTPEQIKAIYDLPYQQTAEGNICNSRFNLAKDCFIMSFCLIGMNSADLYNSKILSGNTINYNRKKTKDRRLDEAHMEVIIPEIIQPVVTRYRDQANQRIFRFYRRYATESGLNSAINKGLKEIGAKLGIDDLEFYAARHSWATIALNKVGIDKYTVHAALNHVDESMKVTDIYIERDFVAENKANMRVIAYVFGK